MKLTTHIATLALVSLSLSSLPAQQPNTPPAARPGAAKKTIPSAAPQSAASTPDPGQQKFEANCSRCHNAPEQISPRIAGTIVRHMRVRASLSAKDEQDILRFLAP